MSFTKVVVLLFIILIQGCAIRNGHVSPPNGGVAITVTQPVWASGVQETNLKYSELFPKPEENNFLKVVNAGYWLANTNGKISQLVYAFDLTNKKVFPQPKVYTRFYFTNPQNKDKPFIYLGTLDNIAGSTKVTHATVSNVELHKEYAMIFEAYSDINRTQLITRINQKIISPVDNSNGCVRFSKEYMSEMFGHIPGPKGTPLSVNKLMISCVKR